MIYQGSPKSSNVDDLDIRLLIHQSRAGCVIGKAGAKIKELREVSSYLDNITHFIAKLSAEFWKRCLLNAKLNAVLCLVMQGNENIK